MIFYDFQIRAWLVGDKQVQMFVHSSPVGDLRHPISVEIDRDNLEWLHGVYHRPFGPKQLVEAGRQLADILLPPRIFSLLIRSLERILPEHGLRVRLCLDSVLIDLPWECLFRPDADERDIESGFLALNPRISLVREAPQSLDQERRSHVKTHLFYAGVPYMQDGSDIWTTDESLQNIQHALQPVSDYIEVEAFIAGQGKLETKLLENQIDIFHYTGHVHLQAGAGYLTEEIRSDTDLDLLHASRLASYLRRANTQLAVFEACNSGRWTFVEHLVEAGIPIVIGAHGAIIVDVAAVFVKTLYEAIAIGLSFDEAVTWARLRLLEPGILPHNWGWQWPMLMVYMLSADGMVMPIQESPETRRMQDQARDARQQTIYNVAGNLVLGNVYDTQIEKGEDIAIGDHSTVIDERK